MTADSFRVEIHSGPDSKGRYEYTIRWTDPDNGRARGQVFHAPLPDCQADSCCTCLARHMCPQVINAPQ